MATISAQIFFGSEDALSYPVSISASFTGPVDSGHTIRTKVLGTAQGSDAVTVSKANDKLSVAYLFVKNMDREKEKYIYLYTGSTNIAKIGGGEAIMLPVVPDADFKVYATEAAQIIEYAVFGMDNTTAKLG
tara:strand:- start:1372 stop:1767 length:396 start_codon:yes stop_codon:yes gene_type:complete